MKNYIWMNNVSVQVAQNVLRLVNKFWYHQSFFYKLLWPLTVPYLCLIAVRKKILSLKQVKFPVPVIVVGNISVGGVGKTPLVICIANYFKQKGVNVGIVSRGYKARIRSFPYEIKPHDKAVDIGDEALLIYRSTKVPMVIAPKRVEAIKYLQEIHDCKLIISDDGLQHYTMGRALEIIVVDGVREFGNGLCLPFGPLREPPKRLTSGDIVIYNGSDKEGAYRMDIKPGYFVNLKTKKSVKELDKSQKVAAVAGIGDPKRFFRSLDKLGYNYEPYQFADHFNFTKQSLNLKEEIIIMTEKDATKCEEFAEENMYYLPITANLDTKFWQNLENHKAISGVL